MTLSITKKYSTEIVCLLLSLFLLSRMLFPGYVITLDMVWTPEMPYMWSANGFNNTFPLKVLIYALTLVMPSWLVQKIFLVALFFLLFYVPYKFIPYVEGVSARLFATGIFALNPFVYSRMLGGQWYHLFAYAFLPLLLRALIRLSERPDHRSAVALFLPLLLIGLFSVHFLYLAFVFALVWLVLSIVYAWLVKEAPRAKRIVRYALLACIGIIIVNLFWIIPAALRSAPLEARFDETHLSAFSAAGNGAVPVLANVAVLGGFWGEDLAWRYYFAWPQDHVIFWVVALLILVFPFVGGRRLVKDPKTRFYGWVLFGLGVFAYVVALGLSDTPLKYFNYFLYEHIPLWSGLRDSQKVAGILALVYATLGGVGISVFLSHLKNKSPGLNSFISIAILALPAVFGMYMWGGMHGQLDPVWYPRAWHEAKAVIDKMPSGEKVLVLPWHGYLSLDFARNRISFNPAAAFFGRDRIVSGRGVEFAGIQDQEVDASYRDLDIFVRQAEMLSPQMLADGFKGRGISAILIITNPVIPHSEEGLTEWSQFSPVNGELPNATSSKTWTSMLDGLATTTFTSSSLVMKSFR